MVEVPPEIKNVIDQQEASLQRVAMWIIGLPRENRAAAIDLARKVFEETFQQASLKSRSALSTCWKTAPGCIWSAEEPSLIAAITSRMSE